MLESAILLATALVLYAFSAVINGSEAAIFSLKPHEIDPLGPATRKRLATLMARPRSLLIVILMWNLILTTLGAALLEGVAEHYLGTAGLAPAIVLASLLMLILAEVSPKSFALRHKTGFALAAAPFLRFLAFISHPVVVILLPITKALTRPFEGRAEERITVEDIKHLVSHSEDLGALDRSEERWIHSIFELDRKKAVDVMVPKDKITALPREVDFATALEEMSRSHFSRVPLYAGSLDQITGILYAKDLLMAKARGLEPKPARLAREPVFVPRWKRCDLLLHDLRARKTHFAVVVDEFGSTVGIVTLETIIQTIIGTMRDRRRESKRV